VAVNLAFLAGTVAFVIHAVRVIGAVRRDWPIDSTDVQRISCYRRRTSGCSSGSGRCASGRGSAPTPPREACSRCARVPSLDVNVSQARDASHYSGTYTTEPGALSAEAVTAGI
jgi:uncharacterized OB-fold protein